MAVNEVLVATDSNRSGLSHSEATQRRMAEGANALEAADRAPARKIFLRQFKSLLIWLLIGAAAFSAIVEAWTDCIAINAILALNAFIGFYQEFSAEKSIAALRHLTQPQAHVWRGASFW